MKKIIVLVMLVFPLFGFSQNPTPTPPTPQPQPTNQPNQNPPPATQNRRSLGSLSKAEEDLATIEEQRVKDKRRKLAREMLDEFYRKPTKKELRLVAVDDGLKNKFAEFLKQKDTGLFKFLNSSKCGSGANVVSVSEPCLNNKIPGAGASFSFRMKTYRIPKLSDLSFAENMFITAGQWLHGLLLDIGDVPLENVSLQTKEAESLSKFQAASTVQTAQEIYAKLNQEGIKHQELVYQRLVSARENTTYLLRSIAYRGTINKTVQGYIYNELDYDKRKDVLIAFRIVQTDADGSVTILWKQLAAKDSPKIIE